VLLIVISIAGLAFVQDAARVEIAGQLTDLLGPHGAFAVQALLDGVKQPVQEVGATWSAPLCCCWGATSVFGELQTSLGRIWRAPGRAT